MSGLPVSGITERPLFLLRGKGVMRLSFEVRRCDLKMVECQSLWSMLHRWLVTLWRLTKERRKR